MQQTLFLGWLDGLTPETLVTRHAVVIIVLMFGTARVV